jgi:hypothetical protein
MMEQTRTLVLHILADFVRGSGVEAFFLCHLSFHLRPR